MTIIRRGFVAGSTVVFLVAGITWSSRAEAAVVVGCGQTITTSTTLTNDVGPCPADGVVIGAAGVTLNLAGHSVTGVAAKGNSSVGIRITGLSEVKVKGAAAGAPQGSISGFDAGVLLSGGANNTITNVNVHDNIGELNDPDGFRLGDGILVDNSRGNTIAHNTIVHNGPWDGVGILDFRSDYNTIQDNVIRNNDLVQNLVLPGEGTFPEAKDRGIRVIAFDRTQPVTGTSILDNTITRNGADGIELFLGVDQTVVRGNTVNANGFVNAKVNGGSGGYEVGDAGILDGGASDHALIELNEVHGNAGGGIMVIGCCGSPDDFVSGHATIRSNNAADNVASRYNTVAANDLFDGFPNCNTNVWFGNTWGSGGFDPACTTTGGTGPRP